MSKIRKLLVPIGILLLSAIFISCPFERNNPFDPLAMGFYDGWQITWQPAVQVYEAFNHTDGSAYRNGFPQAMAIGADGSVHVVGYLVDSSSYYYINKPADSDTFDQASYVVFQTGVRPDISAPADLTMLTTNIPALAYIDENATSDDALYFQEGNGSGSFSTADEVWSDPGEEIAMVRMFWLSSDVLKARLYFLHAGALKWTLRVNSSTINPDPPEVLVSDVSTYAAVQVGNSDIAFAYTNAAADAVYYRSLTETTPVTIWQSGTANQEVAKIAIALDSDDEVHVSFVTGDSAAPTDTSKAAIHYVKREGGTWSDDLSISGTNDAGPSKFSAPTLIIIPDVNGDDRVHLLYERLVPPLTMYPWYAYLSDDGWIVSDESVDPERANWLTMPTAVADDAGNIHVLYSWSESELDRTLMYVKGSVGEAQNQ